MIVNKNYLWDYDWKEEQYDTEEFKCWYIARVLSRGTMKDIRDIGIPLIREYLPQIHIPRRIREHWEFAFSRPFMIEKYGEYQDAI
ncbi:MAG: hypothetical protein FJ218_06825 [Ignavibacteria bacterium]|nr:hypothetical protein [Ignavibacteria bacterium]